MDDDDLIELRSLFLDECRENIDLLEQGLMRMGEGESDEDTLNEVFRAAHSIKGGGATFGFVPMSELTHHMETLLDAMRSGRRAVDETGVDLLLEGLDLVQSLLESAGGGDATADHEERAPLERRLVEAVESVAEPGGEVGGGDGDGDGDGGGDGGGNALEPPAPRPVRWTIEFRPSENFFVRGHDPLLLLTELHRIGTCSLVLDASTLPSPAELDPSRCHLIWHIDIETDVGHEGLRAVFNWVDQDCTVSIEPSGAAPTPVEIVGAGGSAEAAAAPAAPESADPSVPGTPVEPSTPPPSAKPPSAKPSSGKAPPAKSGAESASIRIPTEKIDHLIDLVGELVITQSMLSRVGECTGEIDVDELRERLTDLAHNTRDLQESVMQVRMLPLSSAFSRLPRLVRDLSRKLDKEVELKLEGGETELDKTVLERMIDPLVHLVRNSLDHGLESAAERQANGKGACGELVVAAWQESGSVNIRISDDGRGIDAGRVRAKALAQGMIGEQDDLSEEQIQQLIFAPGFSTAEEVSDVSGRGVGMDVVRRNIGDLGGRIRVKSEPGKGTIIDISLPLSLAILDGQLVSVSSQTFVIPILAIVETLEVRDTDVRQVPGMGTLMRFRGEYLPVTDVASAFSLPNERPGELIVVVETHGQRRGLTIDRVLGQQQVVIKALEKNYKPVEGIAGATIMSDGSVALILDPAAIGEDMAALKAA